MCRSPLHPRFSAARQGGRPTPRQEAKGHGLYAWNGAEVAGGDGVVYVPSTTGEMSSSGNDRSVGYRLVDTFAAGGPATDPAHLLSVYFATKGSFSSTCTRNAYR
ncbi:hypothetical protein ACRAKI_11080 [Saccharothrix isguenensis]